MKHALQVLITLIALSTTASAETTAESKTAKWFNAIATDPQKLAQFVHAMPKGANLHSHFDGALSIDELRQVGKQNNWCIDPTTFQISSNTQCPIPHRLNQLTPSTALYKKVMQAWTMEDIPKDPLGRYNHFFEIFPKITPLINAYRGEWLAHILNQAAAENTDYVELIMVTDFDAFMAMGSRIHDYRDLDQLRTELLSQGIRDVVKSIQNKLTEQEIQMRKLLHCGTPTAQPGCQVKFRYHYAAFRNFSPTAVYAQLLGGFELVNTDPRVVAINLIDNEARRHAIRDYKIHMHMINFLKKYYKIAHISLHAGELGLSLVPPEGLRTHIREAIHEAHAQRISHGLDITYEKSYEKLLQEMAKKNIVVEISLTSNETLMGLTGKEHPLPIYLRYHVPVVLTTDDSGLLQTTLTVEFVKAIQQYKLSYLTVKRIARNSVEFSFLYGDSLWKNYQNLVPIDECSKDKPENPTLSAPCKLFLQTNEKARLAWKLEQEFATFEKDS